MEERGRAPGSVLEFAVLGLLHTAPMHGYQLRKRLAELIGSLRLFSYGSLYPALRRLREAGLIDVDEPSTTTRQLPADAPPLTGRRGKVVYHITAEGKELFEAMLGEPGPAATDDERFGVHFAFFAQTAPDVRLRILEGRRRRVEEHREGLRAALSRAGAAVDRYTQELQQHGLESVDREVRWLNELIDTERRSGGASPGTAP